MKSTAKIIFFMFLLLLFIFSINYKTDIKDSDDFKGLPNLSDFRKLPQSEQIKLMKKIDSIPMDYVGNYFEGKIADYVNNKKLLDLITIDIYEDNLLMYENQNKKQFNNLFISLELSINHENMSREEAENISNEINKEIFQLCINDTYGFLKLNTLYTNFIDNKNMSNYEYTTGQTFLSEIANIEQSTEELETQTIVYNFVHENKNFILRKFGIIANTKELYIEIPIYDIYEKNSQSAILNNLQNISESLYEKLKSNSESKKYIQNNDLNKITISFYTPWNTDQYITYSYTLQ
ncbi:hypothetical protein SAMN05661008_00092 [Alkalithermobacter thermoalcaliphilus JW-YL-7 = DSM 7308]|uniref:Uncharacterized protein n=1 Tax=Alkalithermobacter thermoalcaliphilus JW-YL-7 = DSM 7308 TaxID=1121328 RepID=A0A150FRX1_CLOPD|nr:hypothetical protein JWYL7_1429 [[Clostridium] paradoxum JW-YL-7 = DSM 7308]SHK36618.1 hypothetical protein SAMN05661008_00092 [[Clostridium] paradoxum JW-YL-7 = DSM 7308]